MQASVPEHNDEVYRRRWLIFTVLNIFTFMSTLDASIVNIALPTISKQLGLAFANSQWIVISYLLTICTVILFFGKLGDMFGKIKVFKWGSVLFIIGSFLCGFSNSLSFLVISRIIQAIGAAMTMANSQGIVTEIFPAKERGKALGLIGTFVSLGSITGPSLGGIIISSLGWEYIFWINIPIGVIAISLAWKILPKDVTLTKTKIDIADSLLFSFAIILLIGGLLLGQQYGYANWGIISSIFIGAISFISFIIVEYRKENPMLELSIFKNPLFSISIFCAFIVFIANFCFNILSPFYTQDILGMSALHSGYILMLFPITMAIVAPISGTLSDKISGQAITFAGLLVMIVAQIGLTFLHEGSSITSLALWIIMLGASSGLFQSPNNSLIMSTVERKQLGIAGSINSLVRNLGMVVGISLATSILFSVMSMKAGYRVTALIPERPDIFLSGMHVVFLVSSSLCFIGLILTGWRYAVSRKVAEKKVRNAS
ncbi:MFS transporter [Cytobacillus oceanisediminis]|uniref:MFS transporter n=1 Tax=Cytobacillus oceanisediminis TaxID=665099 RepID=UPI001CCA5ABE|nr:MFS transporter [Cytobacillus oceanisediminis]MBZ9536151.1 MFS transporter [Cytobacillus oceanisediminis]